MIDIRFAEDRGKVDHSWLDTRHTFSFGRYHDPAHMGFGPLRVINEDRIAPKGGFAEHGHKDMEIISYVLEGALEHRDSMGNGEVIRPGDVQRMTAGTGVRHSEFNHSDTEPVHLLQIWIEPEKAGLTPSYEQRQFPGSNRRDGIELVASRDGRDGSVTIHQNADIYIVNPSQIHDAELIHKIKPGRRVWVQVARGEATVAGAPLQAGDGLAISDEDSVAIASSANTTIPSEVILFDLP